MIKKLIQTLDLEKNIELSSFVEDVSDVINESKVLILTSETEGMPVVIYEAMALGVPSVVPDIGDISTVIQHEHNGVLVKALHIDQYVQSCCKLLNDKVLYDKCVENCREYYHQHKIEATVESVALEWDRMFKTSDLYYGHT